jgi:hypothetical protein
MNGAGVETTAGCQEEDRSQRCLPAWWLVSPFLRQLQLIYSNMPSAFVAGLNNTIIQLVYLTNPSLVASGGGANFFQGISLLLFHWDLLLSVFAKLTKSRLVTLVLKLARHRNRCRSNRLQSPITFFPCGSCLTPSLTPRIRPILVQNPARCGSNHFAVRLAT